MSQRLLSRSGLRFVDETKEKGYLVTAAVVLSGDLAVARRTMRGLIMANQRRIHFHKESDASMLVLEQDDSVLEADKKLLYRCVRELGCHEDLVCRHHRAHEEPLLALPDAIAWCWHRGGQ